MQPESAFASLRKQGKQMHSFQTKWYRDFHWLTFCTTQNKVFCFYCRQARQKGMAKSTLQGQEAFMNQGFDKLKNALDAFRNHEKSHVHRESLYVQQAQKAPSVAAQLVG